jgi:putative PEP-CTERM system TPR-repeat lipoprotein
MQISILRLRLCLSFILAGALSWSNASADSTAMQYYEDALSRFGSGDPRGALIQLRNTLRIDPSHLSARALLGKIHLELNDAPAAEKELEMARRLGVDPTQIVVPLARALNRQGKFAEVIETVQPTGFPPPIAAELWIELGTAHLASDDALNAEIAFSKALELMPRHTGAMLGLARIPLRGQQFAEARRLTEAALNLDPDSAEAWYQMGSVYHAQGAFSAAVQHYREAQTRDPDSYPAALGEAAALLEGGEPAQAAERLAQLRAANPRSPEAVFLHARALKQLGRESDYRTALQEASNIVGSASPASLSVNPRLLRLAAEILQENAQYEAAYGFLDAYLRQQPNDVSAKKLLAALLIKLGKPVDASQLLTRLAATEGDQPEILVMLGNVSAQLKDYEAAERYYRSALQQVRGNPKLIAVIGETQFRRGQTEQAITTLKALVDRAPAATEASIFLGILYFAEARMDEARQVADQVVMQQPDNLIARNLQGAIAIAQGDRAGGRRILQAILDVDPRYRAARFNLAKLDSAEGNHTRAEQAYTALLAEDPNDIRALQAFARLELARDKRDLAIEYLEKIRQIDPGALLPLMELTRLYLAEGQKNDALAVAKGLTLEYPNGAMALMTLARVQLARDELKEAGLALAKAAKASRARPEALLRIARLQVRAGDWEGARNSLIRILELDPARLEARNLLAAVWFQLGDDERAATEAQWVLGSASDNVLSIALLGDIRAKQDRLEEALTLYRRAQAIADTPQLMISVHRTLMRLGKAAQALEELQAWHANHPENPAIIHLLADHQVFIGNREAAKRLRERLVQLVPHESRAHVKLAKLLLSQDNERALQAARAAYDLAPQDAEVLDTLGWTLLQLGELDRALGHLREARARNSRSPTIAYHLAVALQEYGKPREAEHELTQALNLGTRFPERADAEARLAQLTQSER